MYYDNELFYYSRDKPTMQFHRFPDVICEGDDTRPNHINQEFANCQNNMQTFYHDNITHFKYDRPKHTYSHFPEIICEGDTKPRPLLTKEFLNEQGIKEQHFENDEHKSQFGFFNDKFGNDFHGFPEVICEDDSNHIVMKTVCKQMNNENINSGTFNGPKARPASSSKPIYESLNTTVLTQVTCAESFGDSGSLHRIDEDVNSEEILHNFEAMDQDSEEEIFCHNDQDDRLQDSILSSLVELEEAVFTRETHKLNLPYMYVSDASDLLSAHAELTNLDDPWKQLQQAVSSGRTIQLTEAGQQALLMIKPDPFIQPFPKRNYEEYEDESNKLQNKRNSGSPTSLIESNRANANGPNTCNAVMLRTESTTDINVCRIKEAAIGDKEPNKCYESSSTNRHMDCDKTLLELDKNVQILSNLKDNSHLKDLLRIQPVSGTLLYSEISDIYKHMTSIDEE